VRELESNRYIESVYGK